MYDININGRNFYSKINESLYSEANNLVFKVKHKHANEIQDYFIEK